MSVQDDPGGKGVSRPPLRRDRVPREQRQHGWTQCDAPTSRPAHFRHCPVPGIILLPAHQWPLHTKTPLTQRQSPSRHHDSGQRPRTVTKTAICSLQKAAWVTVCCFRPIAERLEETPQESSSKFASTAQIAQLFLWLSCLSWDAFVSHPVSSGSGQSYNQVWDISPLVSPQFTPGNQFCPVHRQSRGWTRVNKHTHTEVAQ